MVKAEQSVVVLLVVVVAIQKKRNVTQPKGEEEGIILSDRRVIPLILKQVADGCCLDSSAVVCRGFKGRS